MDALSVAVLLNRGSSTRWGNLGDWQPGDDYERAARRLARELGRKAGLGPGQRVLDLGCGCGDQLDVWISELGVDEVLAFEPDPALHEVAARALQDRGLGARVELRRDGANAADSLPPGSFDRVVALDCAYLFGDRRRTAERAQRVLRPAGVFALTDLVLARGERGPVLDRLSPVFGVTPGHLVSPARYRGELEELGFAKSEIELVGPRVLGGFARHVRRRLPELLRGGRAAVPVLLTAAACAASAGLGRVGYAYLTATRSDRPVGPRSGP